LIIVCHTQIQIILSVLVINAVLGTTLLWSQLSNVQATSNESGTIQCITAPCNFPSSQTMPLSSKSDTNNDTMLISRNGIELPIGKQNTNNQNEPCLSPCPPGADMCIQMCKPTGQQDTANEEVESQNDLQQETKLSSEPDEP
jgi:hypothetical protein